MADIIVRGDSGTSAIIRTATPADIRVSGALRGPTGLGVPAGGSAGQVLTKDSGSDYDTSWQPGGGAGAVVSVNGAVGVVVLNKADIGLGNADNTTDLNKPISTATQAALDLKASVTQKPRPLGSRVIGLGDSIMAAVTPTGQFGSAGPFTDSRPNMNAWFERMCAANSHRFTRMRNAGVGGDVIGGYGTVVTTINVGATSVIVQLSKGVNLYNTGIFTLGTLGSATTDSRTATSVTDNGNGTFTITWASGTTYGYAAGSRVGWGMLGRLYYDVIRWSPEICLVMAGTNNLNNNTSAQIVSALMDMAGDLRAANIEPIFLELLPRSTYTSQVPEVNDILQYNCRTYAGGSLHLIPLYDLFATGTGTITGAYTDDGLHPSVVGNIMIANIVNEYMSRLPMRLSSVPLAAYDDDPTNLLAKACFVGSAAGGGGLVPTGWTYTTFFTTLTTPNVEAPAVNDGIVGNWFTLTCTTGAAGSTSIYQTLASTPATNDKIALSARIRTTGMSGGCTVTINFVTNVFNNDLVFQLKENFDGVIYLPTSTVAGTTNKNFTINITPNGGAGKLWVAQPYMVNLTTLGRNP
jgi:hypothetical protein